MKVWYWIYLIGMITSLISSLVMLNTAEKMYEMQLRRSAQ